MKLSINTLFGRPVSAALLLLCAGLSAQDPIPPPSPVKNPAAVSLVGDWQIKVTYHGKSAIFDIVPPEMVTVTDEKYESLLPFSPAGPPWRRATVLTPLTAEECSVENGLVPGSLSVSFEPEGEPLVPGVDYILDTVNANIGRKEGGRIGSDTPVYITYRYIPKRIDSVVYTGHKMRLVPGIPRACNPIPPSLDGGETRLVNIFLSSETKEKLTDENLFPILDDGELLIPRKAVAKILLPKTWEKLNNGEPIKILAWGDSVTAGEYVLDEEKWQSVFIKRLRERFPNAEIELVSEAWGGRTTADYLHQPPGSEHNYHEKVLGVHPDLIVTEFVNDCGGAVDQLREIYAGLKHDFDKIGAEWIIVGPHYIRPSWMGLTSQKNIDDDPRPYTAFIRAFGKENNIPVAETPILYGRLWRQGIPYVTLMVNDINHPNPYGLSLFADALMVLFGKE
ncbi:MAG: SGNH/GDSL hydrolase family protein [Thermoguttaceae bacterium]|jgi:hypothetical protein